MAEFSIAMAIVDFIPVIFFCCGSIIFQRLMYEKMSKEQFALFSAGTVDVIMAGFCKALYKLLYAIKLCDFVILKDVFFPVQSFGFLLAGLGTILMILNHKDKFMLKSVVPPVFFSGKFIFVILMCLGLGCMDIGLCVQAGKDNKKKVIPFLILSFLCSLCMGRLSGKSFDKEIFNWVAEIVNSFGQGFFLIAALIYKRQSEKVSEKAES